MISYSLNFIFSDRRRNTTFSEMNDSEHSPNLICHYVHREGNFDFSHSFANNSTVLNLQTTYLPVYHYSVPKDKFRNAFVAAL